MEKENPFKKIGQPLKEVPKELKAKVMSSTSSVKLLIDLGSACANGYNSIVESLIKPRLDNQN